MTLLRVASLMRFYERTLRDVIYKTQAPSAIAAGDGVSGRADGASSSAAASEEDEQAGPALAMAVTVSVLSHLKELEALAFQVAISALNMLATKCLEKVCSLLKSRLHVFVHIHVLVCMYIMLEYSTCTSMTRQHIFIIVCLMTDILVLYWLLQF